MARKHRTDYEGAWHHVMHRGARRVPIFKSPSDYYGFLSMLDEMDERFGLEIHAYSLMPNHYHLLIRSVMGNLSQGMQFLNGNYTQLLNKRYQWDGPVFRGRFRSQAIEDENYLRYLLAYIHLNPIVANLVRRLSDEAWTSHRAYLGKESKPDWLVTKEFTKLFGGHKKLHEFVLSVRREEVEYPDDFNEETGLYKLRAITGESVDTRSNKARKPPNHHRLRDPQDVLATVMKICGASIKELQTAKLGPNANPERRFAIWALNHFGDISQREIGKLINVSFNQVSRLISRMRNSELTEPIKGWVNELYDVK